MFIFFNLTFFPLFLVGLLGQPRRVFEYAQNLQVLNDFSSVSAFFLGASFLIFIANFVWSMFIDPKAPANPWNSLGLEWQTPTPFPPTTSSASRWCWPIRTTTANRRLARGRPRPRTGPDAAAVSGTGGPR